MDRQGKHYRTTVELPIIPDYRPLGESGVAAELWAPAAMTVRVLVDGDDRLASVELGLELRDGRYRTTRLVAEPPAGSWLDLEAVRELNYSRHLVDALAGRVEARFRSGDTYTAERPMENPDPLWPVALCYTVARALNQNPTVAVAERFGIEHAAAAQRVRRARAKGFLPPTQQGRAR